MLPEAELTEMVYGAAKRAFTELFKQHPDEHFYYCSLTTDGAASGPAFTAWSAEALRKAVAEDPEPNKALALQMLKWSYGESPYFCFMDELFEPVREAFQSRPELDGPLWDAEYELRMRAMETAMCRLDQEGIFGSGDVREDMVIAVEVMPPDHTNTERVKRLNRNRRSLEIWMVEYDNS